MGSTATSTPALHEAWYRRTKIFLVVIGVVAVIVAPVLAYFLMSYNSVNGTVVELVTGNRRYQPGMLTVNLEVHVWSLATSVDTTVQQPLFALTVDGYSLGVESGADATFSPGGYASYFLTFETDNGPVAAAVGEVASNDLVLSMSAVVSATWFSAQLTRTVSAIWTWTN